MRTALLVLLLSAAGMGKGYAYDFSSVCSTGQTLYYSIIDAANVALVAPNGNNLNGWNGYTRPTGDIVLPETVQNDGITYSVTSIGEGAFSGCGGLTSLTIPNSVTSIGEGAFSGCGSLTSLTIPNSVTSIGTFAFSGCGLGQITVAASNPNYDSRDNCNAIIETSTNTLISGCKKTVIPNSVTSIGGGAFSGCWGLTTITIPNSVTSIGISAFSNCSSLNSITIPNSVTSIGGGAFFLCSNLTSVTIPNSVTSIGGSAFSHCTSLTTITVLALTPPTITTTTFADVPTTISVYVPCRTEELYRSATGWSAFSNIETDCSIDFADLNTKALCVAHWDTDGDGNLSFDEAEAVTNIGEVFKGNTYITSFAELQYFTGLTSIGDNAFAGCSKLASVNIPNSVTSIGDEAFRGCTGLTSVTIGNSVTSIGNSAFIYCSSLTSITIPNSVTSIGNSAFWSCSLTSITIPNSVTSIGGYVFYFCSSLTSVTIPNSVTSIGGGAFYGCSSLTSITIPNSVTSIGRDAFSGCSSLTSITIPNSVTSIGEGAFRGCSSLTSVTIPNSVTSIGERAFLHSGLEQITVVAGNPNYDSRDNCNAIIETSTNTLILGCKNTIIPNSVTSIGKRAFVGCGLTSITIPQSVDTIGGGAFVGCSRLTTVYYNAKKAYVSAAYEDDGVFDYNNCPNLTTVHIGADVQEIGFKVFQGCTGVHLVVAMGPTPAMVGDAFADFADNSVLVVSCGQRLTYYSMWNKFEFNNIMEDCNEYMVSTSNVGSGGTVTASPTQAQMGQTVTLTVTPNAGMRLSSISMANASDPSQVIPVSPVGKAASNYRFVMPPFDVVVTAVFAPINAIGENNSIAASVYPNPTNGQVRIEAEGLKHIIISNMLGQQIFNGSANGDAFEYDFGKHGAGLYLVSIETANGVAVKKVSVVK